MKKFISQIRNPASLILVLTLVFVALMVLFETANAVVRFIAYWRITLGH